MKSIKFFLLPAVFIALNLFSTQAQSILLKFTGLHNTQNVHLDSIKVRNLTQGGDTSLYWPDTSLLFVFAGINNHLPASENQFAVSNNFPNPFHERTQFSVCVPGNDNVDMVVSDLYGRVVAVFKQYLPAGIHSFEFRRGKESVYLLSVSWRSESRCVKMFSLADNPSPEARLTYEGTTSNIRNRKSNEILSSPFPFIPGDRLLCLGFHNGDTAGFVDNPQSSHNYAFHFGQGYPCLSTPFFVYGGQLYHTVQIGTQCWMKENLNIGAFVPSVATATIHSDVSDNGILEKYCYNNDTLQCATYGGLYDWDEMMQYDSTKQRGICPLGWVVPSGNEWCILTTYLDSLTICSPGGYSANAGGKLKETGFSHWVSPNTGATNEGGFTALPGGERVLNGAFAGMTAQGYFGSSEEGPLISGYCVRLDRLDSYSDYYAYHRKYGHSVRCVKE